MCFGGIICDQVSRKVKKNVNVKKTKPRRPDDRTDGSKFDKDGLEKTPRSTQIQDLEKAWRRQPQKGENKIGSLKNSRSNAKRYQLEEYDGKKRSFECPICSRRFRYQHHMKIHAQSHFESFNHLCEECGKTFHNKGSLALHQRAHKMNLTWKNNLKKPDSPQESLMQSDNEAQNAESPPLQIQPISEDEYQLPAALTNDVIENHVLNTVNNHPLLATQEQATIQSTIEMPICTQVDEIIQQQEQPQLSMQYEMNIQSISENLCGMNTPNILEILRQDPQFDEQCESIIQNICEMNGQEAQFEKQHENTINTPGIYQDGLIDDNPSEDFLAFIDSFISSKRQSSTGNSSDYSGCDISRAIPENNLYENNVYPVVDNFSVSATYHNM